MDGNANAMIRTLVECGADLDARSDVTGWNVFESLMENPEQFDVIGLFSCNIGLLADLGADPNTCPRVAIAVIDISDIDAISSLWRTGCEFTDEDLEYSREECDFDFFWTFCGCMEEARDRERLYMNQSLELTCINIVNRRVETNLEGLAPLLRADVERYAKFPRSVILGYARRHRDDALLNSFWPWDFVPERTLVDVMKRLASKS